MNSLRLRLNNNIRAIARRPWLLFAICSFLFFSINSFANANEFIEKETAVVRIMNKAAGKARTATVGVGKKFEFEKLEMVVRSCKASVPFAAQDNFMFIEVAKKSSAEAKRIFSGWMTASEPGDNPLQDADYDLWLIGCE